MKTFDEKIREVQAERQRNEFWVGSHRLAQGEDIYIRFVAWCNGYNDGNGKTDGDKGRNSGEIALCESN